jgi:cobalt/nickel transport system permease protein
LRFSPDNLFRPREVSANIAATSGLNDTGGRPLIVAHIPDGFLSASVMAGTAVLSTGTLAVAVRHSRQRLAEREAPVLGATTAFVFAAQMLNFPLGAGTSAHLLGGVLVGVLVGPWAGMLVMFAVLLVQALLFQDGGVGALGANTLNVAVLGVGGGMVLFAWLQALLGAGVRRRMVAAAMAAYGSTVLVGLAVAVELALSGTVPLAPAIVAVGGGHALIGVGEGVVTVAILGLVFRVRPELIGQTTAPSSLHRGMAVATAVVAVSLAALAPFVASAKPDVLERAIERLGLDPRSAASWSSPFEGYTAPLGGALVAALVGVVVVFAVAWGISRAIGPRRTGTP